MQNRYNEIPITMITCWVKNSICEITDHLSKQSPHRLARKNMFPKKAVLRQLSKQATDIADERTLSTARLERLQNDIQHEANADFKQRR